jgi:hypothetical protein
MNNQNEVTPEEISELNSQVKISAGVLIVLVAIILATLDYAFNLRIGLTAGATIGGIGGMLLAWLFNSYLKSRKFKEFNDNAIDFVKNNEFEKAIYQFELAVYLRPKNPALYYNLAWLYSLIENEEKSIIHLYNSKSNGFINLKAKIEKNKNFEFIKKSSKFNEFYNTLR